ncbi:endonuclease/exonuclease/phosphatase family protein [Myxococcota bacterium]|nr:endonuclease/exonuclease/phosphatase family protein [Myxococcota bacterium]
MAIAILIATAGCEPFADDLDAARVEAPIFRRSTLPAPRDPGTPATLRVLAWNVKYGAKRAPFWFDCWGDRVKMTRAEVVANLAELSALVREVDPDVLVTEELEVGSRRSAYVDMVAHFLETTELGYAAYFSSWESRYVPSEGLGRMNLGLAIFSRFPIRAAEKIRQDDRTDQDALTRAFYIHRVVGRAELEVRAGEAVAIYAVHTEAYDEDGTKQRQIAQILELARAEVLPFVVAGDFNELPPTALDVEGFLDERARPVCSEDFAQPPYTPEVMAPFFDELVPWIPLERFGTTPDAQRRYFTHSVLGPDEVNEAGEPGFWNRTLDYLFASPGTRWRDGTTDVLQVKGQRIGDTGHVLAADPLRLSDHAPVVGDWEVVR